MSRATLVAPFDFDSNGNLLVNVAAGGGAGGTSSVDATAFTAGFSSGTPIMAEDWWYGLHQHRAVAASGIKQHRYGLPDWVWNMSLKAARDGEAQGKQVALLGTGKCF